MVTLLLEPTFGNISNAEVFKKLPVKWQILNLFCKLEYQLENLTFFDEFIFRVKASPLLKFFSGE